jgi:prepilin-type N-terminal cleavage/methylation domain-containing protein
MRIPPHRPAYTLLEVLLATAIGALLMAGLYTSLNITLRHAQAGRDKVEQITVARALLTRMAADIAPNLPAPKPPSTSSSGAGGASSNQASNNSSTSGSQSGGASSLPAGLGGTVTFNYGVQGDSTRLAIYTDRVPRELDPSWKGEDVPTVSDLRCIYFWLSGNGLSREELKLATADDVLNGLPSDLPDDPSFVIAPEVRSLSFQYFDGSNWQDSWDGTQTPSSGGSNAQGPPLAIAITIGLAVPGSDPNSDEVKLKTYRHVVVIRTANGATHSSSSSSSSTGGTSP